MSAIPDIEEIRRRRKRSGLSQSELAAIVGISQSHLAKIENKKSDPSYGLAYRIFDVLDRTSRDECWQYMSRDPVTARRDQEVRDLSPTMKQRGFSQLPVVESGRPIGLLTERRILAMEKPYEKLLVADAMEEPVLVPREADYSAVVPLVGQFQAVLVTDRGKMVGIITATDLIGHRKKATSEKRN